MPTDNAPEATTHLSLPTEEVECGRQAEIIIARHGQPAARSVAMSFRPAGQRLGVAKGKFESPADIDGANPLIDRLFLGLEE